MDKKLKTEKKTPLKGHWLWGLLVLGILLIVDLLTKVFAQVYFDQMGNASITLIPDVLILTYAENPGVAFSGAADAAPLIKIGIVIGTALIMVGASFVYFKIDKRRTFVRWCLVLVVAGGVGNLIDRVLFRMWAEDGGGVRDMVYIDFSVWVEQLFHVDTNLFYFGVCNFADFFIVGGAIALVLAMLFFDTDAFFPTGKYKELAKEAAEKEVAKKAARDAAKAAEVEGRDA